MWIDSHCHLDASEFDSDRDAVRSLARQLGVQLCVIPAVHRANFEAVRELAHRYRDAYALGIHPLYVPAALDEDLDMLDEQLTQHRLDPRLVAVGEIGLDYFIPSHATVAMRERQWRFYLAQLRLAKRHQLPVILHVRKSADMLLKGLRQTGFGRGGIAHAFNGSFQQAQAFLDLGFKLGFGGTVTFERSLQIRRLAMQLPLNAIVLETDAPDIVPAWLYKKGQKNTPTELPRIGAVLAELRGMTVDDLSLAIRHNTLQALTLSSSLC